MSALLDPELLTTPEAAVAAGVEVRDIHRLIDEHILPEELYSSEATRRVWSGACALVRFWYESAEILTPSERRYTINHLFSESKTNHVAWTLKRWRSTKPDWTCHHRFLTLNLSHFIDDTIEEQDKLARAREIVIEDPMILGGLPVIKGTRVPVYDVAASAAAGLSVSEIKDDYPSLSEEKIELAILYAKATPQRGRPKLSESRKGKPISRRVFPRRSA